MDERAHLVKDFYCAPIGLSSACLHRVLLQRISSDCISAVLLCNPVGWTRLGPFKAVTNTNGCMDIHTALPQETDEAETIVLLSMWLYGPRKPEIMNVHV